MKPSTVSRRSRRAKWRSSISKLAQSEQAKSGGYYDRPERRRRAKELWGEMAEAAESRPVATRVMPQSNHWMGKRIDAMQRGLIALMWRGS